MTEQQAKELLKKYDENRCTPEENALVESWYLDLSSKVTDLDGEPDYPYWHLQIKNRLPKDPESRHSKIKLFQRVAVAASVVICLSAGVYFYTSHRSKQAQENVDGAAASISPGSNKAFLVLAGGRRISLTGIANGSVARQAGIQIVKTHDGEVRYVANGAQTQKHPPQYHTIQTPNGGQYQVILPDGTRVWLNAASSLTYPASFEGLAVRSAELTGEAYFEIARDKLHPFIVKSAGQQIHVLGTHFNLSAYQDEARTTTTLLEGSIKVAPEAAGASAATLVPGQQSILTGSQLKTQTVETADAVAWKNGKFVFSDETIQSIMGKIARWYDVEVEYKEIPVYNNFSGSMSRFENIAQILRKIEMTNKVHFKLEGRRVIVLK